MPPLEASLHGGAPLFARSEVESRRFALAIGRLDVPDDASYSPEEIALQAADSGLDVLVIRYPALNVDWFFRLRSNDFWAIHADTLLYFEKDLRGADPVGDPPIEVAPVVSMQERATLARVARQSFANYRSHYFANPLFDRAAIAEGYAEWALSYSGDDRDDGDAYLARMATTKEAVGFAAVTYEPVPDFRLVAVRSQHSGHGLYGSILSAIESILRRQGAVSCRISTQVHNLAVIRTVTRGGYRHDRSLQTIHLVHRRLAGG